MDFQYLALIEGTGPSRRPAGSTSEDALTEMGLREYLAPGRVRLYVSKQMPVMGLPGGATIVGHLFTRDGILVTDDARWPAFSSQHETRKHIVDNFWGEYLLFQPDPEAENGFSVMRSPSPSGDLPCFYLLDKGVGFITSDVSMPMLLGLYRKEVDWGFIEHCLAYPHRKMARTGMLGVRELLPGCRLWSRDAAVTIGQAWSPWDFVGSERRHSDPHEAAAELRDAVSVAVSALAGMEESILLELSGGLDSSIVGVCLRGSRARVACCTVVPPVRGADERFYAGQIAQALDVELQVAELRFDHARFHFIPPSSLLTPRLGALQYAIADVMGAVCDRHGLAACFSGGGGDAVFHNFSTAAPAVDAYKEHGIRKGIAAIRDLSGLHGCTIWKAGRLAISKLLGASAAPCQADPSFLGPAFTADTPEAHPWFAAPPNALPGDRERIFSLADNQLFRECLPRGPGRRLRMPLLSQPVVEACLKVPSWMWISGARNRAIARLAFEDLLPTDVLNRRSKGTFIAYLGAVYQRNRHHMRDYLVAGELQARGLLDIDALRRYFAASPLPRDQSFTRIFELCMIENWVRHHSAPHVSPLPIVQPHDTPEQLPAFP